LSDPLQFTMEGLLLFWFLGLGVAVFFFLRFMFRIIEKRREREKLLSSGIWELDQMDGGRFEQYLQVLFESRGYIKVRTIGKAGDFGCDLIMQDSKEKIAVQAKHYRSKAGVKAVQEVASARNFYSCNKAIVATNSYFTVSAKKLAKANNIELWDKRNLIESPCRINAQ